MKQIKLTNISKCERALTNMFLWAMMLLGAGLVVNFIMALAGN